MLTEGIILFRKPKPKVRVYFHWFVSGVGLASTVYGFLAIYNNKESNGKPHFSTYHGLFGVGTVGLLIIQGLGGNFANLTVLFPKLIPGVKPAFVKWGHRLSGCATLTAAYTSLILGLCSFWFTEIINASTTIWWGVVLSLMYPYLYAVFNADFSKGKPAKAKN